jgi:outer membrane protein assembly factor BamB
MARSTEAANVVRAAVVVAVAAMLSGCWIQPGVGPERQNWNPVEPTLTAATVAGLEPLWSSPIIPGVTPDFDALAPVVIGGSVFASMTDDPAWGVISAARFDAATGEADWIAQASLCCVDLMEGQYEAQSPVWQDGKVLLPYTFDGRHAGSNIAVLDGSTGDQLTSIGFGAPCPAGTTPCYADSDQLTLNGNQRVWATVMSAVRGGLPITISEINGLSYRPGLLSGAGGSFALSPDGSERVAWRAGTSMLGFAPGCSPNFVLPELCDPTWTAAIGSALGAPAIRGEDVVFSAGDGSVRVLDLTTGVEQWRGSAGVSSDFGPVVTATEIIIAGGSTVVAFPVDGCGAAVCEPLWTGQTGASGVATTPAAAGDVVYVATTGGGIVAFGTHGCGAPTCSPLVTVPTAAEVTGGPVIDGGRVFAGLDNGDVVAFGLAG